MGVHISFAWVPAHVGVEGNEEVDVLAKQAHRRQEVEVPLSKSEAKGMIWAVVVQRWQEQWNRDNKGRHRFINDILVILQKLLSRATYRSN